MKASHKIYVFFLILCSLVWTNEIIDQLEKPYSPEFENPKDLNGLDFIVEKSIPLEQKEKERNLIDFRNVFWKKGLPFSIFRNIKHELEETNANPNSEMQIVEFNSAMKSEQSTNDPRPKVVGFSSGLNVHKSPDGKITVQKFNTPFGNETPHNKEVGFNRVLGDNPLRIEPIITPSLLKIEPFEERKPEGFASFLNEIINHEPNQQNNDSIFRENQIFQKPDSLADVLKINIDTPNRKDGQTNNFFESLFGQKKPIPRLEPQPKLVVLQAFNKPHRRIEFPKEAQTLSLPNPTSFLENLFGNKFHHQVKSPINDIDETDMNPLAMIFGNKSKKLKKITHKRRTIVRKFKRSHKKATASRLGKFLNGILGKQKIGNSEKTLISHPEITPLGLHTGVAKLLNLIESSEKDRLTQPLNEPKNHNPLAAIFGKGDEELGDQSSLTSGILETSRPTLHLIDPHPSQKAVQCDSDTPVLKRVFDHLPSSYNLDHIPLMNNFYHMRNIKNRLKPIKYPSLGHRKHTLEKIRNNQIELQGYLPNKAFHRKEGKMHLIKPTETHLVSRKHYLKKDHPRVNDQLTDILNLEANKLLKLESTNQKRFSKYSRLYRKSNHKRLHHKHQHRLNHYLHRPTITNIATSNHIAHRLRKETRRHTRRRRAVGLNKKLERFIDRLIQENNDLNEKIVI